MSTFYIDPQQGSDANDGSTIALAWRTITGGGKAPKKPGDFYYIAPGSVFPSTLDIGGWQGTAASPITIDVYPATGGGPTPPPNTIPNVTGRLIIGGIEYIVTGTPAYTPPPPVIASGPVDRFKCGAPGQRGVRMSNTRYVNISNAETVANCSLGFQIFGSGSNNTLTGCKTNISSDTGFLDDPALVCGDRGAVLTTGGYNTYISCHADRSGRIAGVNYGVHGWYLKGPGNTCIGCTATGSAQDGFSIRMSLNTIKSCLADACGIGIAWFGYGSYDGPVVITDTNITNCTTRGLYLSAETHTSAQCPHAGVPDWQITDIGITNSRGTDCVNQRQNISIWQDVVSDGVAVPKP